MVKFEMVDSKDSQKVLGRRMPDVQCCSENVGWVSLCFSVCFSWRRLRYCALTDPCLCETASIASPLRGCRLVCHYDSKRRPPWR